MLDALVIGAGPAGLATSQALARAGVTHRVLERGEAVGHTWRHLYDSLTLHTARGLSTLPGLSFPPGTPLFPTRDDVVSYLDRYAREFRAPVETGLEIVSLAPTAGVWTARCSTGEERSARAVVVATGIVASPVVPEIPSRREFRGQVLHSVDYRRPDPWVGRSILVVGAGNSAGEIAVELAAAGALVTLAVRSGAAIMPRQIAGLPIHYLAMVLAAMPKAVQRLGVRAMGAAAAIARGPAPLPRPAPGGCPRVPLIGLAIADALRSGAVRLRPGPSAFTREGVRFEDGAEEPFDSVMLATGYRAAVELLGRHVARDDCGFARRTRRVVSLDRPGLFFVGHNYDLRGGLRNISRDGPLAARAVARYLAAT